MWKKIKRWFNYKRKYKEMKRLNQAILMDNQILKQTGEMFFERSQDTSFTARCMLGSVAMQNGGEVLIPAEMYQMFVNHDVEVLVTNTEDGTISIKVTDANEKPEQNSSH